MPQTAFISLSFSHRHDLVPVIQSIKSTLTRFNITPHCFVEKYNFPPDRASEMMQIAFDDIQNANFLIAEVTHKAFGVGIEIGYAVALNKPIIGLHHTTAKLSSTVAGVATHIIPYESPSDLVTYLSDYLSQSPPVD